MGKLYYGDNLHLLRNRDYFPDESIDLIYLDPHFNYTTNQNTLSHQIITIGPSRKQCLQDQHQLILPWCIFRPKGKRGFVV